MVQVLKYFFLAMNEFKMYAGCLNVWGCLIKVIYYVAIMQLKLVVSTPQAIQAAHSMGHESK